MLRIIVLSFIFAACFLFANAATTFKKEHSKLPNFIKICHRSDPQLNVCARNSFNALKPRFGVGIPELYVPPIDPLIIPEIKMDQDSGAIFLHSTYKNINIHGLKNLTLNELQIDPEKVKLIIAMSFPNISMAADYVMDGKIMLMPLIGEGVCKANFSDVDLHITLLGQKVKKNGHWFIKTKSTKIKYTLGNAKIHFDNLFNGDSALGGRMNNFLNENWESLSEELQPLLEKAMSEIISASTDKLFNKYSLDDLLPE